MIVLRKLKKINYNKEKENQRKNYLVRYSYRRYEDAFNRLADEIHSLATYQWLEGSI